MGPVSFDAPNLLDMRTKSCSIGNNGRHCETRISGLDMIQSRSIDLRWTNHSCRWRVRRARGRPGRKLAAFVLLALVCAPSAALATSKETQTAKAAEPASEKQPIGQRKADLESQNADFELFLDRLMMAESDGRNYLKNPRSSALGPYQFIKGTFLYVARRHFQEHIAGLTTAQILAKRTDRAFSRKVVAQYTRELAVHLARNGLPTTYGHLRLAYLLGPSGATRVLKAEPTAMVQRLISRAAVVANPFLANMTAQQIIRRANRDISMDRSKQLAVRLERKRKLNRSGIRVRCNLARPSCRRWLALRKRKLARLQKQRKRLNKKAQQ